MARELEIYMVTHKEAPLPDDPCYIAIQAGAAVSPSLGILGDDTGDNISSKNVNYSELTAHYWIWKNSTAKAIGVIHYRRFFAGLSSRIPHNGQDVASGEDLLEALQKYNFIVPHPTKFYFEGTSFPQSIEQQYSGSHNGFDLLQLRRVLSYLHPEYLPAHDFVMRGNSLLTFNLLVAPREIFGSYCQWAFPLFLELENQIPLSSLSGYQARVIAFLSERVFTIWAAHNRKDLHFDFRSHIYFDNV